MGSWDEDDYWDDRDEPPRRAPEGDSVGPAPTPDQIPVEHEVEGSVYMVPDAVWGFAAPGREDHPGACVRCHVAARVAFLYKGTDPRSARPGRCLVVQVEPSGANGLAKPTAFALDPRRLRLHRLLTLHGSPRRLGRLEPEPFALMRRHFDALAGGGA